MAEYLISWNNTATKEAIKNYVAAVADESGPNYVPPEERIAVFDNDGTLWCEKPQVQFDFIAQRLIAMAEKDVSLRKIQPWKMAYDREFSWASDAIVEHYKGDDSKVKVLMGGILKAFSEMTVEEFTRRVVDFFASAPSRSKGI